MKPQILSIGTAVPAHAYTQKEVAEMMLATLNLSFIKAKKLEKIYSQTCIDTRYSVIKKEEKLQFFISNALPTLAERNEIYKKEALPLAVKAATEALEKWGSDPKKITHVISVSCTGIFAPGLEFSLIEKLQLSHMTERFGINFMGCFGAFRALAAAAAIVSENPSHCVLLVCTELCSLHFLPKHDWDHLIANALFSDGAAAAIVGVDEKTSKFEIIRKKSMSLPDSFEAMQWQAGDEALLMRLSSAVPKHLKHAIKDFVGCLLQESAQIEECTWAIHPGGKAIIEQIEEELRLKKSQTEGSWKTLSHYGNMSSATFLFVLNEVLKSSRQPWIAGLGFGPGLSLEGILLRSL